MAHVVQLPEFVTCLSVGTYPVSLSVHKLYRTLPDAFAESKGFVRVIDDSGEDYLYPRQLFTAVGTPGFMAIKKVSTGSYAMPTTHLKKSKHSTKSLMLIGLRPSTGVLSSFDTTTHAVTRLHRHDGLAVTTTRPMR